MTQPMPIAEPSTGDPSHFLPSEVSGIGRKYNSHAKPYSALGYKVKALNRMVDRLDEVPVRGATEGPILNRLIAAVLDEADADGLDPAIKQKFYASAMDAILRLNELNVKLATESIDLETKRSDTRLKRQMWKDKQGIKGTVNASVEPPGSIADVAALMRDK